MFVFEDGEGGIPTKMKCHSQVILSQSEYFKGLLEFKTTEHSETDSDALLTHTVHDFSPDLFQAMIAFFYLGEASVSSDDLIDLLQLSQQYLLSKLKLALEKIFVENIDKSNLVDTYMVAKAFECNYLKQKLQQFGEENGCSKELREFK